MISEKDSLQITVDILLSCKLLYIIADCVFGRLDVTFECDYLIRNCIVLSCLRVGFISCDSGCTVSVCFDDCNKVNQLLFRIG